MRTVAVLAVTTLTVLALTACGGSSTPAAVTGPPAALTRPWTDVTLAHRLGLVPSEDGLGWLDRRTGCEALVILKTPQEVAVYDGDVWLVKSPTGAVGVKVMDGEPRCMARFRALLATVPARQPR